MASNVKSEFHNVEGRLLRPPIMWRGVLSGLMRWPKMWIVGCGGGLACCPGSGSAALQSSKKWVGGFAIVRGVGPGHAIVREVCRAAYAKVCDRAGVLRNKCRTRVGSGRDANEDDHEEKAKESV